jgi:hypothetical protein
MDRPQAKAQAPCSVVGGRSVSTEYMLRDVGRLLLRGAFACLHATPNPRVAGGPLQLRQKVVVLRRRLASGPEPVLGPPMAGYRIPHVMVFVTADTGSSN